MLWAVLEGAVSVVALAAAAKEEPRELRHVLLEARLAQLVVRARLRLRERLDQVGAALRLRREIKRLLVRSYRGRPLL